MPEFNIKIECTALTDEQIQKIIEDVKRELYGVPIVMRARALKEIRARILRRFDIVATIVAE